MGGNPAFPNFRVGESNNGARGKVQVVGFVGSVTIICPCGNVLVVPVIPGQYARTQCGSCQTIQRIETITYHEPKLPEANAEGKIDPEKLKPVQLSVHIEGEKPRIITAPPNGLRI
jgi:hypothetical protein